ncbi:MAG: LysR family transcriptional regulator [Lachnospiraceae bacterium]|nr:LysR family transcriptional regulator [Lachnospiraceae bacterium]
MKYFDVGNISVAQMITCIKIAQYGSFSKAADALHTSQSCLSKRVSDIEMQMGIIIFIRGKNIEIRPTKAGALLISRWKRIVDDLQNAYIDAHELQTCKKDNIVLGLTHTTDERKLLIPLIHRFNESNADIEVRIEHNAIDHLLESFERHDIDILFLPKCYYEEMCRPEYEVTPLVDNPLGICVSPLSDLAGVKEIAMKELQSKRFIVPRVLVPALTMICRAGDFTPDISYFTNDSWGQGANLIHPDEVFIKSYYYRGSYTDDLPNIRIKDVNSTIYIVTHKGNDNEFIAGFKKSCIKNKAAVSPVY